MNKEEEK